MMCSLYQLCYIIELGCLNISNIDLSAYSKRKGISECVTEVKFYSFIINIIIDVWGTVTAVRPEPLHTVLTRQLVTYARELCERVVPISCSGPLCTCREPVIKWVLIFTAVLGVRLLPCPQLKPLSPNMFWMIALQLPLFNNCVYCFHSLE